MGVKNNNYVLVFLLYVVIQNISTRKRKKNIKTTVDQVSNQRKVSRYQYDNQKPQFEEQTEKWQIVHNELQSTTQEKQIE